MPQKEYSRETDAERGSFAVLGSGRIGGKASGLVQVQEMLSFIFPGYRFGSYIIDIPRMIVLRTGLFRDFVRQNNLMETVESGTGDSGIAMAFLKGEFSPVFSGDLLSLARLAPAPLAVRSSSLLEDALSEPFAGVYLTKMIPNNQLDPFERFRKLLEAVKLVYASTFFEEARAYADATGKGRMEEEMAVIVQQVAGSRRGNRFYPAVSGVARSWNYYPTGNALPEEGVVNCALGLGKTIVDGGKSWCFSPRFPASPPPFSGVSDLLKSTQTTFYAVNLSKEYMYDPTRETEYLVNEPLSSAEEDGTLGELCSTYDPLSDRVEQGISGNGPRIVDFSSLLKGDDEFPELLSTLLTKAESRMECPVEIEFAVDFDSDPRGERKERRFSILQLRPLAHRTETLDETAFRSDPSRVIINADTAVGNGVIDSITDIVYIIPELFKPGETRGIGNEIGEIDARIRSDGRKYLLIGFGRWGSSDPWLGIPVRWSQISGVGAIAESVFPGMYPDFSQGSHFFHNVSNLGIPYLYAGSMERVNWKWLASRPVFSESAHVRHARIAEPITIWVNGRTGRGGACS